MSDINLTPTTTEIQAIEPDYKRAYGELSFLVASAHAYGQSGDREKLGEYLTRAFRMIEQINNYPLVIKTPVE